MNGNSQHVQDTKLRCEMGTSAFLLDRVEQYARLMRMDRPIGTFLLLWPTLWALWIASDGSPDPAILLIFMTGVFVMRSAGCVINDFADRDKDPYVERTKDRPLAAGKVAVPEALILFVALCGIAFVLVLMLNTLALYLALVGVFWTIVYPFMKRFVHFPQLFLGFAFSWGIPMAFAAQTDTVPALVWWILVANLFWVMVYDTLYAMADRKDDLAIGVKSTAILFGHHDRMMVGFCQVVTLLLLITVGRWQGLNSYYYGALAVAGALFLYQQWLIRGREDTKCFQAFLNNTWVGAAIFLGLVLAYL